MVLTVREYLLRKINEASILKVATEVILKDSSMFLQKKKSSVVTEAVEARQIIEAAMLRNGCRYFSKVVGEVVGVDDNSQSLIHSFR